MLTHSTFFKWAGKTAVLAFTLFALQSCGDDDGTQDPPPDTTDPSVTIKDISAGQTVWNTISLTVEATDDDEIADVELFINNESVAQSNSATVDFDWNTFEEEDGSFTLKAVATDVAGNIATQEISVDVLNTLISASIPADFFEDSETGVIFLSNADGSLITSMEFENGDNITLKANDFDGEEFFLSEGYTPEGLQIYTFAKIKRGSTWTLSKDVDNDDDGVIIGTPFTASLELTGASLENGEYYNLYSHGEDLYEIDENQTLEIGLVDETSPLYIVKYSAQGEKLKYHYLNEIIAGENSLDLSLVNNDFSSVSFNITEDIESFQYDIEGFPSDDTYDVGFEVDRYEGNSEPETVTLYYPNDAFASYFTDIYYTTEDYEYEQFGYGIEGIAIRGITASIELQTGEESFNYTSSGSYDFLLIYTASDNMYNYFILPAGTSQETPLLSLPASLSDYDPSINIIGYAFYDHFSTEGYNEFIDELKSSEYGIGSVFGQGNSHAYLEFQVESSGDRKASIPDFFK
ncbi:Ig-like domain-containing protein [Fulvivirga ligni]|uniref:Ig-like domain-containing protein n=1 Tax=Fulvivirga ligni TaxID=2904246 RepID=UPI001F3E82E6|nr:Ig-like domain-containing protein [Fulvivirga ligni]UII19700.1 Ig-like domain-containing protein [Fulvivirga ligni]